jgi:anti-anti-sigma factor
VIPEERIVRVEFGGDLDVYKRDIFVNALPTPGHIDRLIIDFSRVPSIDSTIITALMRSRHAFEEAGGDPHEIILVVTEPVRRLFDIAGLTRILTLVSAPVKGSTETPKEPETPAI